MDSTILAFLIQDGVTSGAIYALLGLSLVLVFAVTRVIFIPQGEFVAYGALTLAVLDVGRIPGTLPLLMGLGIAAFGFDLASFRQSFRPQHLITSALVNLVLPAIVYGLVVTVLPMQPGPIVRALLAILIIAPMGLYIYRVAFRPLANASVLVLLITSVGVHLAMMGLGLFAFGAEGLRAQPLMRGSFSLGFLPIPAQSLWIYGATIAAMVGLYIFFERTILGKALRATAVNRLGARLVGVRTNLTGGTAFVLASTIGAISGVLIAPITTIYYDTGFLIGLKGFVAAIFGGLVSYPIAAIGALGVGTLESFSSFWASAYKEVIVFTLIIPVLLWRSFGSKHADDEE